MISSKTSYKLLKIIEETWPGLYRQPKVNYNNKKIFKE